MNNLSIKLNHDHKLFNQLTEQNPDWWKNIKNNKDLYIQIRQHNHIDVYCNGGKLLNLSYSKGFKASVHFEYVPLVSQKEYIAYLFMENGAKIRLPEMELMKLNNFDDVALKAIKKRICKFNPPSSEKGIQADFVLKNDGFIDTEFQPKGHSDKRFDLVWADADTHRLFVVELKTINDSRLANGEENSGNNISSEKIEVQLGKYRAFLSEYKSDLILYYSELFKVMKKLDILRGKLSDLDSLDGFTMEERPVLLIGDCTQHWINKHREKINSKINKIAFGCFYQGRTTRNFYIPSSETTNKFLF